MSEDIKIPYELPEGWKWVRLDSIAELKGGKRIPAGFRCTEQITPHVYIRVSDMQNDSICMDNLMYISEEVFQTIKKYTISKNDLYLTIAGTIGRVGTIPDSLDNMNLTENALKITNIKCDKKYLLYSLKSEYTQNYFSESYHQVAMPKLSMLNASKTLIPLPPTLEEQQRIVNRIETLFAKLDQAKEKAQNVVDSFETREASILHKAFTGELTKKWREENCVGDDSWEEKTVGEAMHLQAGKNIPANEISATRTDLHSFPCFGGNGIRGYVKSYNKDGSYPIIGRQGALCGNLNFVSGKFYATEHAVVVTCPNDIDTMWVYYTLKTMNLNQYATATAQPGLAVSNINQLPITIPTINDQQEIVRILDTILEKESKAKEAAEAVLEQIDLLKKSILARAFRGKL